MKYPRTPHFPFSPGATSDDRIIVFDNFCGPFPFEGVEVVINEKLDGSNACLTKSGVYGRSHGQFTDNPWDRNLRELHGSIGHYLDADMRIFGENMYAIHSLEYHNLTTDFYVFGVQVGDEWISWEDVLETAYLLDLNVVPLLWRGRVNDLQTTIESLVKQPSLLGGVDIVTGIPQMEGCVMRIVEAFHNDSFPTDVVKWVRPNHVQSDKHWQQNWRKATIIH